MRKLLIVALILALAVPAFAGWGVPLLAWFDPGDGPGPPIPHDPGDGPILAPVDPAPEIGLQPQEWMRLAYDAGLAWQYLPGVGW